MDGWSLMLRLWLIVADHDASKDRHHHLWLHLNDIFWQCIDFSTDLASHRYCILCIGEFILQHSQASNKLTNTAHNCCLSTCHISNGQWQPDSDSLIHALLLRHVLHSFPIPTSPSLHPITPVHRKLFKQFSYPQSAVITHLVTKMIIPAWNEPVITHFRKIILIFSTSCLAILLTMQ